MLKFLALLIQASEFMNFPTGLQLQLRATRSTGEGLEPCRRPQALHHYNLKWLKMAASFVRWQSPRAAHVLVRPFAGFFEVFGACPASMILKLFCEVCQTMQSIQYRQSRCCPSTAMIHWRAGQEPCLLCLLVLLVALQLLLTSAELTLDGHPCKPSLRT